MPPRRSTRAARDAPPSDAGDDGGQPAQPAQPPLADAIPGPGGGGGGGDGDPARDDAVALLNDAKLATTGEAKVRGSRGERRGSV